MPTLPYEGNENEMIVMNSYADLNTLVLIFIVRSNPELRGVIPNSFDHIFNHIARSTNTQFLVRASYLEIYQEEIRDLLSKDQSKRLELRERTDTGVYVKDLSSFVTKSVKEIEHVMNVGNQNRSVG